MHVIVNSNEDIDISNFTSPDINIEPRDPDTHCSALQMFATSLALCTCSVLTRYAEQIGVDSNDLAMHIQWSYDEGPFRINYIEMGIDWAELPKSGLAAAGRAASLCTPHHTLAHPPGLITCVNA